MINQLSLWFLLLDLFKILILSWIRTNCWKGVRQEPDLADVDIPGISIICGHNDVLRVLWGEASDEAWVEEAHLAAPEHTDPWPHGKLRNRWRPEIRKSNQITFYVVFDILVVVLTDGAVLYCLLIHFLSFSKIRNIKTYD